MARWLSTVLVLRLNYVVAAERAVNIVGAEAKLVATERAVGLPLESQVAAERAVT